MYYMHQNVLAQTAQEGGGVTVHGGTQEMCGWGTAGQVSGHGEDGVMVGLDGLRCLFQPW